MQSTRTALLLLFFFALGQAQSEFLLRVLSYSRTHRVEQPAPTTTHPTLLPQRLNSLPWSPPLHPPAPTPVLPLMPPTLPSSLQVRPCALVVVYLVQRPACTTIGGGSYGGSTEKSVPLPT